MSANTRIFRYSGVILLLWLYAFLRLHHLWAMPLFVDESYYLDVAQKFWKGQFLLGAIDGRLLHAWYNAVLGPYPPAAGWVQRAGSILVGLPGLAAFYALVRSFVSHRAGMVAMILWIATPYLLFFERLAISDALLSPLSVVAVWVAWVMFRRQTWVWAAALGAMLAVLLLAKLSGIVWLPLPLVVIVLLPDTPWRKRLRLGLAAYGSLAAIWGPLGLVLRLKGYSYLGVASVRTSTTDGGFFQRTSDNIGQMWQIDRTYLGLPILVLALIGLLYWLRVRPRPALFALAMLGMSAGGALISLKSVNSRYALNHVVWVLLPLAVGIGLLIERKPRGQPFIYALMGAWMVAFYVPFQLDAWNAPSDLTLNRDDRYDYIQGESSGFAIRDIGDYLGTRDESLPILGFVANCQTLRLAAHPVKVTCPKIRWDGTSQQELMQLAEEQAASGPIYIVGEELTYINLSQLPQPYTALMTVERPDGKLPVTLFRIEQGARRPVS